jgi:hypothetical protein
MMPQISPGTHSSVITLTLEVNGHSIEVDQSGPDFLLLRRPVELAPGEAVLVTTIDNTEVRSPVNLPDGAGSGSRFCRFG